MDQIKISNPLAPPELYVDDTAMFTHGSKDETPTNMCNSILDFVQLAKALKLKLSLKGTIVSKIHQASKTLVKLLRQIGVDYQAGEQNRDFGVNYTHSPKMYIRRTILKKAHL